MSDIIASLAVAACFIGIPWIILHYITRWKTAASLTSEDENLLDDLHDMARRLDDRVCTIERILTAENPAWRSVGCDPADPMLSDLGDRGIDLGERSVTNQPSRRIGR